LALFGRRPPERVVGIVGAGVRKPAQNPPPALQRRSVVEDDRFIRDSPRRLMKSLGHSAEAFSSAPDFLASPQLVETACLIADVNMPAMTGIELYRHLIEMRCATPTILVTAYPDDDAL
jgi:FixJ family two-component response regulator